MSHDATNWAVKVRGISPTEARVLWHLADCHNPAYGCFPKQEYLAENAEIDERSVRRCLISLRGKGHINWVEQREKDRRKANRYSLAFEGGFKAFEALESSESEPDTMSGSSEMATGQECPSEPDSGGELNRTPESAIEPVREPVKEPVIERETAQARNEGFGKSEEKHDDQRSLLRRVKAMEIGRGGNVWPGAIGSSTSWTLAQFEKLDEGERLLAEERRDAYLAICKAQGVKPVALGNYFRDRKFMDVTVHAAKAATAKLDRVPVKPFGPVWTGMRLLALAKGPDRVDMPGDIRSMAESTYAGYARISEQRARAYIERKGITLNADGQLVFPDDFERAEYRRRQCDEGFPVVNRLHKLAAERSHEMADGRNGLLAELCEPVPVGSDAYEAWRAHHTEMNWPLWPDPGQFPVVWFPKGGPEGMARFVAQARELMAKGEGGQGDADAA